MAEDTGVRPSPNIWQSPATYELENRAFDPDHLVESAIRGIAEWSGRDVLDIGCGTGFHLPRFAIEAAGVTGVEPHPELAALARRRVRRLRNTSVLDGSATALPLPDSSVDVVHARWAYFFGPGCEPGLVEIERVLCPGGTAFVIDNDPTASTFGSWFRRGFPDVDPARVETFWQEQGWQRERVLTRWRFESTEDLAAVVRIELPTAVAEDVLSTWEGREVDYAVNVWWRRS